MIIKHFSRPLLSKNKQTGNFFMFFFFTKIIGCFCTRWSSNTISGLVCQKTSKDEISGYFFSFFYQNHGFDKIQCGNFVNQYFVV